MQNIVSNDVFRRLKRGSPNKRSALNYQFCAIENLITECTNLPLVLEIVISCQNFYFFNFLNKRWNCQLCVIYEWNLQINWKWIFKVFLKDNTICRIFQIYSTLRIKIFCLLKLHAANSSVDIMAVGFYYTIIVYGEYPNFVYLYSSILKTFLTLKVCL